MAIPHETITPGQEKYLLHLRRTEPGKYAEAVGTRLPSDLTKHQASKAIDHIKGGSTEKPTFGEAEQPSSAPQQPQQPLSNSEQIFRASSTRGFIERHLRANGVSPRKTKSDLIEFVGNDAYEQGALVFTRNPTKDEKALGITNRQPLPIDNGDPSQHSRFRMVVDEVAAAILGKTVEEVQADQDNEQPQERPEPPKPKVDDDPVPLVAREWLRRVQTVIRPHVRSRGFAEASYRLTISGAKLFRVMGNDERAFQAVEYATSLAWPEDSKRELQIQKFNPQGLKVDVQELPTPKVEAGEHKLMSWCETLLAAGIPVALVGPAGCGKSFLPAQLADKRELPFGLVPMTAGASTTWLTGAHTLEGFITRPFVDIYENGGIFLFDEMDAADPNMLLLVNNAIANQEFQNPANGKILKKHEDFIPFAAMNTLGTGANRRYVGRERLDMATLDRWAQGMVEMDYDEALEKRIFESIITA
jgi:hypothetical protein